jgi:drug/metabolite transporter (DMT)-like permease
VNGLAVAGLTAIVSGFSVFVNSYAVHSVTEPSVFTTAKNMVAFLLLAAGTLAARGWRRARTGAAAAHWTEVAAPTPASGHARLTPAHWAGLAYVGVVGGGVAFVLFFDGLARTTATPAAFLRDTLVIWVVVIAVAFKRERVTAWNVGAVALLVVGEVALAHGIGHLALDSGNLLVLASSVLWAVEAVIARRLLADVAPATLSMVRMGVGAAALLAYLAATGALGALFSLGASQFGWVVLTGCFLAGYVGTWMTALSRARALDVTSVLVASALVTALLQAAAGNESLGPQVLGLCLIAAGTAVVVRAVPRAETA